MLLKTSTWVGILRIEVDFHETLRLLRSASEQTPLEFRVRCVRLEILRVHRSPASSQAAKAFSESRRFRCEPRILRKLIEAVLIASLQAVLGYYPSADLQSVLNSAGVSRFAAYSLEAIVELCVQTGDAEAWEVFLSRTRGMVAATAANTMRRWKACKTVSVDDIIQEVYLKLSKNNAAVLRGFHSNYPNAILGYLRATASSVAFDYCKSLSAARRDSQKEVQLTESEPMSHSHYHAASQRIERNVLIGEVDRALQGVASGPTKQRDSVIFWLYYRQGFTADSIAAIPWIGLTTKGVESTILRLTRLVRAVLGERQLIIAAKGERK